MRRSSIPLVWILLTTVLLSWGTAPAFAEGPIEWKTYTEGMALAKATQKKVFLFFGAAWCRYCEQMGDDTFRNADILRILNDEYVSIKVDTDRELKLASQYRVRGVPEIWFINSDGKAIANRVGYAPAGTLIKIFSHIRTVYGGTPATAE